MHQRFPVYCRPLPFLVGAAAFVFGLHNALNWAWAWSLQTGNIFAQISVPTRLLVFTGVKLFFWMLSAAGLIILIVFGTVGQPTAKRARSEGAHPLWMPRFRFYPLTLALGLFLAYFGVVFLFNASVTGDDTPAGFVAFVYLNYAGIVRRGLISVFAALLLMAGLAMATMVAFKPGLGFARAPRTTTPPPGAAPVRPEPTAPVAATPVHAVAPTALPPRPRPVSNGHTPAPRRATKSVSTAARPPRAPSTGRSSSASRPARPPA